MATIEVTGLTKEFDVDGGVEVAVDDLDLDVDDGEFLTLLGPSGCGKTTTLRCIAGLETPTSGTIQFNSIDVTGLPANERNLAMMFQNIALYPHMTIQDNIAYPLKVRHIPKQERVQQAEDAAEAMQIADLLQKYPGEVSGGQRQRAALARTVVQDPGAFLMDEPLSDLDAKLKSEIQEEILRVHKRLERPTIYVTHDQQEALRLSDRVAILNDGEIVQIGAPREIYNRPRNRFVAEFIGNPSMNFFAGQTDDLADIAEVELANQTVRVALSESTLDFTPPEVTLGVRPQGLALAETAGRADFTGTIELLEPLDERTLVTVETGQTKLRAIIKDVSSLAEGNEVYLAFSGRIYLFDAETHQRVGSGYKSKESQETPPM